MRILAAIADPKERKRIAGVLRVANHEVVEAASSNSAAALFDQPFEIAFVDVGLTARARLAPKRLYVISVIAAAAGASEYGVAYAAGADDAMRITAGKEEIIGRAGALARIQKWACPTRSVEDRLSTIAAWNDIDHIVGSELAELLGEHFAPTPFTCDGIAFASEIPLTLATEQLRIRLGLGIDRATIATFQETLLGGDTSPEALADALREMANTAAGAIKRAALASGVEFTIGLPSNTNILDDLRSERRAWKLQGAGVSFACVAVVSSSSPRPVPTRDLKEGMVLARDVRNAMGMLIAPAGTSLTRTTVEQLSRLLGASATLEVSDLAA